MYHPAAAVRNGRIMIEVKKDFKKIKLFLEDKLEEEVIEEKEKEQQMELI